MPINAMEFKNQPIQTSFRNNSQGNENSESELAYIVDNIESMLSPDPMTIKASKKTKIGVLSTTTLGVATAMALILKGKGYSLAPAKIFKKGVKPLKEWGLFSAKYDDKKHEVEKMVISLAAGSVGGGLIGGALFDKKENMKAKYREAIIQIVGNIMTPLACVSLGMRGFEKIQPKISMQLAKLGKIGQGKLADGLPKVLASAGCLVSGIFLGNKVGNTINEKAFKVKDNRKIKLADMSPHIDDLCLAISLVASKSSIGPVITRFIPAALMVAGVSTGTMQERPERLKN